MASKSELNFKRNNPNATLLPPPKKVIVDDTGKKYQYKKYKNQRCKNIV